MTEEHKEQLEPDDIRDVVEKQMELKRILITLQEGGLLGEQRLSRVWGVFNNKGWREEEQVDVPRAVGIITAFKRTEDPEKNVTNNQVMAIQIHNAGFGTIYLDGFWIYNKGLPDEEKVEEVSVLVTADKKDEQKLFKLLCQQAAKYNQESFIFKKAEEVNAAGLYKADGTLDVHFDKLSLDKLGDIYSKMKFGSHRGRPFIFESYFYMDGMMSRMLKKRAVELGHKFDPKFY